MQKWFPDEFESSAAVASWDTAPVEAWETLPQEDLPGGSRFRKESRFADPASLMANLTQAERTLIFDLVEQDVAAEYEEREVELKKKQAEELAAAHADYETRLNGWVDQFGNAFAVHLEERLHETAQAAARLAILLAGKITRALVPLDPQILERALQTALYKAPASDRLSIRMNPEDAQWLQTREDTMRRLGIESVVADRRIERGGCLVQSGQGEWDATLGGQLESLGEIIQESIATAGHEILGHLDIPAMPGSGDADSPHDISESSPTPEPELPDADTLD